MAVDDESSPYASLFTSYALRLEELADGLDGWVHTMMRGQQPKVAGSYGTLLRETRQQAARFRERDPQRYGLTPKAARAEYDARLSSEALAMLQRADDKWRPYHLPEIFTFGEFAMLAAPRSWDDGPSLARSWNILGELRERGYVAEIADRSGISVPSIPVVRGTAPHLRRRQLAAA